MVNLIRAATRLEEIIGQYTELVVVGSSLRGRCPYPDHTNQDQILSFSVSTDNQLYYCYGCKKVGNVITFLQTYKEMNLQEAIEFLNQRIPPSEES